MTAFNKSIYQPQLSGGIERKYAVILILSWVIMIFFGDWAQRIEGTVFVVGVWVAMAWANSYDYLFFVILIRYVSQQNYYIAHTKERKVKIKKYVL